LGGSVRRKKEEEKIGIGFTLSHISHHRQKKRGRGGGEPSGEKRERKKLSAPHPPQKPPPISEAFRKGKGERGIKEKGKDGPLQTSSFTRLAKPTEAWRGKGNGRKGENQTLYW